MCFSWHGHVGKTAGSCCQVHWQDLLSCADWRKQARYLLFFPFSSIISGVVSLALFFSSYLSRSGGLFESQFAGRVRRSQRRANFLLTSSHLCCQWANIYHLWFPLRFLKMVITCIVVRVVSFISSNRR
jgi:hypothetical protein